MRRLVAAVCIVLAVATSTVSAQDKSKALKDKLTKSVTLDKAMTTISLGDAIDFFANKFDFTAIIDNNAFKAAGVQNAADQKVSIPRLVDVRLDSILSLVVDEAGAKFEVKRDYLEIGPGKGKTLVESLPAIDKRMAAKMAAKVTMDRSVDVPLRDAADYLSDNAKINVVIDRRAFAVAGVRNIDEQTVKLAANPAGASAESILAGVAKQIGGEVKIRDTLAIITAEAKKPAGKAAPVKKK